MVLPWSSILLLPLCLGDGLIKGKPGTSSVCDSPQQSIQYERLVNSAETAGERREYQQAATFYRQALALSHDDGALFIGLGRALFELKNYREAAAAFEQARNRGFYEAAVGAYRIGVCYALAGDEASALRWLQTALQSRWKDRSVMANDERLATLRKNPLFQQLIGALPATIKNRDDGWRYDLRFLAAEVQRLHPSYSRELPAAFRERRAALEHRISALSDAQIAVEIMALFASLGDAHSVMAPAGMKKGVIGRLPLQLYAFSDGIFVIDAPSSQRDLIGSQVLEIGGRDVNQLGQALRPYLSRDNDHFLSFEVPFALTFPDLLAAVGVGNSHGKVTLKVRKAKQTKTVESSWLPGPLDLEQLPLQLIPPKNASGAPPDYLSRRQDHFWLKQANPDTLYVQLNQCRDQPGKTLDQFAQEIDAAVKTSKPQNMILDVRLNNGGNYEATFGLMKSLVAFQNSRVEARLLIIIGRGTLSAAQNLISTLDDWCNPIFVGEPSGSKPCFVGDDTVVILPYSGILGSIACAYHQTNFRDSRDCIAPRIPIALSSQAYFAQKDPAMEAILLFLKNH